MKNIIKLISAIALFNTIILDSFRKAEANFVATPNTQFAVMAGGQVMINNGADFEGELNNPQDDALIYAANGFNMNNLSNTFLSTQRDNTGKIIENNGKKLLSVNAVAVSSPNPVINASNSPYSGLSTGTAPFTVVPQSIEVLGYEEVKSLELSKRSPGGSSITFDSANNPINNLSDWNAKFPQPGTIDNPKLVNVTQGLNIPNGVTLDNYVITVNGTINFNGTSTLNNTALIVNNGGLNLGSSKFNNSAVFAPGNINMNSDVRFSGNSLLASQGDINFNGATVTTKANDELRLISQSTIHYNGALNTRGQFYGGQNIMFNSNTTLYGSLKAKNNITCNSNCAIIATSNVSNSLVPTIFSD